DFACTAVWSAAILCRMPRTARVAPGGVVYHVLNRGVGKMTLFRNRRDFAAFQRCLLDALVLEPMRVLSYCVMSNHWHLVLWPRRDGDLARFMLRLTITHVRRWLIYRDEVGSGHVYQGRYKSFAVQDDAHLSTVCRYVERNRVRAGLCKSCADWPWSSAGQQKLAAELRVPLAESPVPRRKDWAQWVDQPQTEAEEAALSRSIRESRPFGSERWTASMKQKLGWREPGKPGRPRKKKEGK
ncbi:MAG TPA: transposase, partial [Bryobacteraceae bacterium]|nr:transposase [Bryobacteraceae bacterium]